MATLWDCWLAMCQYEVYTAPFVCQIFVRHAHDMEACPAELEWYPEPLTLAGSLSGCVQIGRLFVDGDRYAIYTSVPTGTIVAHYRTRTRSLTPSE